MARPLAAANLTESRGKSGSKKVSLVKMSFDTGDVRLWNGRGTIVAFGETYRGFGDLGIISIVEESLETRPFSVDVTLTGIPATNDFIAQAETEDIIGRDLIVYLGFLNDNYDFVADPDIMFKGQMDVMPISIGKTMTVTITAENRLVNWLNPNVRWYTDSDQKLRYPDDNGFEFEGNDLETTIVWGGKSSGGGGGGGGTAISPARTSSRTDDNFIFFSGGRR